MSTKSQGHRCRAKTKSGKPCQAPATEGGLCFFHANPNKASELGRIGGRKKRYSAAETAHPLPKLDNVISVRDAVAQLIADVYTGRLHPKIGAGLAPLLNLQLRAIEMTEVEQLMRRVAELEKQLAEEPSEAPVHGNGDA